MTQPTARVVSDREFVLEHTFRAPAARIWAAYTDPSLIPRWWAPRGGSIRIDALDVRPGGAWRFVQTLPHGGQQAVGGTYLEVKPVTRLVYTFSADGMPGEIRATVELAEKNGVTHLTLTNLCGSKEQRDGMLRYGAAAGAKAAWDALAEAIGASSA